ncbi:MAG: hypothetical protein ABF651_10210 [Sporolactobacillus sp.]
MSQESQANAMFILFYGIMIAFIVIKAAWIIVRWRKVDHQGKRHLLLHHLLPLLLTMITAVLLFFVLLKNLN